MIFFRLSSSCVALVVHIELMVDTDTDGMEVSVQFVDFLLQLQFYHHIILFINHIRIGVIFHT